MSVWGEIDRDEEQGCRVDWLTVEWEPDMQMKVTVAHHCVLSPHATGNHRDAAGNVRVRFEE